MGKAQTQREGEQNDIRVLLSGEVRRRVGMWKCKCDYNHLPRNAACSRCGCLRRNATTWIQEWWNEDRLPWNWRGENHPITLGMAWGSGKGGKGKAKGGQGEGGNGEANAEKAGGAPSTRPKAKAQPPSRRVENEAKGSEENDSDEEGWQRGGPSAKQRKKEKKAKQWRNRKEDEDMGYEGGTSVEEEPPRVQPIDLPEVPRVTLVRRLEARKVELEQARKEDEGGSMARKLERRVEKLANQVKLSGGHTERRQTFTIIDIEKSITRTESALAKAEEVVEERKQAWQEAQREEEELRQKLENLRKRLSHVASQKAQEVTEKEEAKALREAMDSMQKLAGNAISEEVSFLLRHLRRILPKEESEEEDESLSSSSGSSEESNDTLAAMEEDQNDSFNEEDYDPGMLEELRAKRRRLAKLQRELREAMEGAKQRELKEGKPATGQRSEGADTETLVLFGVQSANVYRRRIKEAAIEVDEAKREGRREAVPQVGERQGTNIHGAPISVEAVAAQSGQGIERRWETAEEREEKTKTTAEAQRRKCDIERAEAELKRHSAILREVVHANAQIQQQEALQAQQELETMAMQAARAHSTGNETQQQQKDLQIYWYTVLQEAAKGMATKAAAPLRVLPKRASDRNRDDRTRWGRSLAARTQSPRISSASSGMGLEDAGAERRRKDRARKQTSRSPRGRRGRALTRDL